MRSCPDTDIDHSGPTCHEIPIVPFIGCLVGYHIFSSYEIELSRKGEKKPFPRLKTAISIALT